MANDDKPGDDGKKEISKVFDFCGNCDKKGYYGDIKFITCLDCGSNNCQHRINKHQICYKCVSRIAQNKGIKDYKG